MIGRSSFHARDSLSLYSVKSLTLQMEKKEPTRRSVAGPQTRSRTRLDQQAGAGPSRQAPPALTTAQPGPSTQNMSFEEAYGYYAYGDPSSFQAGSSGYAGDQGPYYPPSMHSSYGPQVGPSTSARFNYEDRSCRASPTSRARSPPLARSSSRCRTP